MSHYTSTTTLNSPVGEEQGASQPKVNVIEGETKFRDNKRWKLRYCVLTKLSPAADCLQLQIYRDEKERARHGHTKASLSLEQFLALETGFTLDKESHTLAIICQDVTVVLAFDNRERLIQWSVRIANNLGDGQQFLVQLSNAPPKSKLTPGPVRMHVSDRKFCLTAGIPPRLLGTWEVANLRRYGIVDGKLVFEGGSRCGKGEGVHVLVPDPPQLQVIIDTLELSNKGQFQRMPSRRLGHAVCDSPRKSMSSRLSELHNRSTGILESSANISSPGQTGALSVVSFRTAGMSSPTPKSDDGILGYGYNSMSSNPNTPLWQDEVDSYVGDSYSNASTEICHCNPHKSSVSSPTRMMQPSSAHMTKPLPSSMERCLSCMSKLGQAGTGEHVLSPSWTMELSTSSNVVNPISDRMSVSSHGSSGGVTEYCYDTPRSVLSEIRKNNARVVTTQGHPPCCGSAHSSHQQHSHQCSSPCRSSKTCASSSSNSSSQHSYGQSGCCTRQYVGCNSGNASHGSPIYYNGHVEQKAAAAALAGKSAINHHGHGISPNPYENYDFPRCTAQPIQISSVSGACCENSLATNAHPEWSKRKAMDRNSIASSSVGSDHASEFYDTPKMPHVEELCICCAPNPATSHHQSFHSAHRQGPVKNPQQTHLCGTVEPRNNCGSEVKIDPMENYDVPPIRGINGEGKMPVVNGSSQLKIPPQSVAIYAEVDKSKKIANKNTISSEKSVPGKNETENNQPMYANVAEAQAESCAKNVENTDKDRDRDSQCGKNPANDSSTSTCKVKVSGPSHANYANLEFAQSLQLYENAHDLVTNASQKNNTDMMKKESKKLATNESVYENLAAESKRDGEEKAVKDAVSKENNLESRKASQDSSNASDSHGESISATALKRSSSVPCKGGHANRDSASSSDSGVAGDCAIFLDENSPLNDLGSLCIHESLPRKSQRSPPISSMEKTSESEGNGASDVDPSFANRHYETIDEVGVEGSKKSKSHTPACENRLVAAVKASPHTYAQSADKVPLGIPSDANSSSGASDMSDYIDTLSSGPKHSGGFETQPCAIVRTEQNCNAQGYSNRNISSSPKKSTSLRPRSGKEYYKIDRAMFKN